MSTLATVEQLAVRNSAEVPLPANAASAGRDSCVPCEACPPAGSDLLALKRKVDWGLDCRLYDDATSPFG